MKESKMFSKETNIIEICKYTHIYYLNISFFFIFLIIILNKKKEEIGVSVRVPLINDIYFFFKKITE